jgi:hypothetical protein
MKRSWTTWESAAAIWGGLAVASAFAALASSSQAAPFVAVAIFRPITFVAVCLSACLVLAVVLRQRAESAWTEVMRVFPLALGIGVLVSCVGVWNDGSGSVPTALRDAVLFVFTLGIYPTTIGPLALMRGAVLALAVLLAVRAWRSQPSRGRAVVVGVVTWVSGAVILSVQSWMAAIAAAGRGLSLVNADDAMRALGAVHTDSFWSNFQADRFFAGVGRQLDTGVSLSSSAILFLVCLALAAALAWRIQPWSRFSVIRRFAGRLLSADSFASLVLVSACVAGVFVGLRGQRFSWTALDVASLLVLLATFKSCFVFWSLGREIENLSLDEREHPDYPLPSGLASVDDVQSARAFLLLVALVGGALLGWPVLISVLSFVAIGVFGSASVSGWMRHCIGKPVLVGIMAATWVLAGGLFASRTTMIPLHLGRFALAWAAIAVAVIALPSVLDMARRAATGWKGWLPFLLIAAAGLFVSATFVLPVVLAALAILLVAGFVLRDSVRFWRTYAVLGLVAFGWIATCAALVATKA